jgi:hypothetical protein
MAQVKNNSSINITRTQFSSGQTINLGNRLFNGYIYALSLDVGFDGNPSTLTLNLALNKTIKDAKDARTVQQQRKDSIASLNKLNSAKNTSFSIQTSQTQLTESFVETIAYGPSLDNSLYSPSTPDSGYSSDNEEISWTVFIKEKPKKEQNTFVEIINNKDDQEEKIEIIK